MNYSKLTLTALFVFCLSLTYGQNKTGSSFESRNAFTAISHSNISESISDSKSNSIFVTANNLVFANSVMKRFTVNALRNGYVKILDQKSNIVATVYVEKGRNDIHFLCFNTAYELESSDIDLRDPKYMN